MSKELTKMPSQELNGAVIGPLLRGLNRAARRWFGLRLAALETAGPATAEPAHGESGDIRADDGKPKDPSGGPPQNTTDTVDVRDVRQALAKAAEPKPADRQPEAEGDRAHIPAG